jgi:hypothetical protein
MGSGNGAFFFNILSKLKFLLKIQMCVGKIALFDKALVSTLACGALAMCAMWVGNCFKKCAVAKK